MYAEIEVRRSEFDQFAGKVVVVQSDSDPVTQNFRLRLEAATKTVQDCLQQNTSGADLLNQVCTDLVAYNDWVSEVQQLAASNNVSMPTLLGLESRPGVRKGQDRVCALSASIDQLAVGCRSAMDNICPLGTACSFSSEILSDLTGAWKLVSDQLPLVRQKSQNEASALADFRSDFGEVKAWLVESQAALQIIRTDLQLNYSRGVESYSKELSKQVSPSPSVEAATECVTLYLSKKEKLASETAAMVNRVSMKNRDFDGLLEKLRKLRFLNIETTQQFAVDVDDLINQYSELRTQAKQASEQSNDVLSCHLNFLSTSKTFRIWREELSQSLLSVSDFSGDRYTLLARFDWFNHIETLRQKGDAKSTDLKDVCLRCLATSPSEVLPALLAISTHHLKEFQSLYDEAVGVHRRFSSILAALEQLDSKATEVDRCLLRFQDHLAKYETPFSENLQTLHSTVDVLSQALDALNGAANESATDPGLCSEASALRKKFAELSKQHTNLKSILEDIPVEEDPSAVSTVAQREKSLDDLATTIERMRSAWQKASSLYSAFSNESQVLGRVAEEFASRVEAFVKEEATSTTVVSVSELMSRCGQWMDEHDTFPQELKRVKSKLALLTPCTTNATLLDLQSELTRYWTQYVAAQQLGRSLVRRLEERIDTDARLKADLANCDSALSEAENELQRLATSDLFLLELPLPKPLMLATTPVSELSFNFAKFSTVVGDFVSTQGQSVSKQNELLSDFLAKLASREKEIDDLMNQPLLEDNAFEITKATVGSRLKRLVEQARQSREEGNATEALSVDVKTTITKTVDELASTIEGFVRAEADSRQISDDMETKLENIREKLGFVSKQLNKDAPLLTQIRSAYQRLPVTKQKWKIHANMLNLLADEVDGLRGRVDDLNATIGAEIKELTRITSLQIQLSDLHSAHVAKLEGILVSLNQPLSSLEATSEEDLMSQFSALAASVKASNEDLQSSTTEYNRKCNIVLSNLADAVVNYSSHRRQPVGMLVTRIGHLRVTFEETERQAEKLARDLAEELERWEEFLSRLRRLRQWIRARESDFQVFSTATSVVERMNGLRSLEETMAKTGRPMLDEASASGRTLVSLRPKLTIVGTATTAISDRYEALVKAISEVQSQIKGTVVKEEEVKRDGQSCAGMLDHREEQLKELCRLPIIVSAASSAVSGIKERLQKLGEFLDDLEDLKSTHLRPLDERVQQMRTQLDACSFDQSEISSVVLTTSGLWEQFSRLCENASSAIVELNTFLKACNSFYKVAEDAKSWLDCQKEAYVVLDQEVSDIDCNDIRELTDRLAKRANDMHKFCMDLHSNGENYLTKCTSECSRLINAARSVSKFLVQNNSSQVLNQENLISALQSRYQSLSERSAKRKDEISALLFALTAYDELFTSLQSWLMSVGNEEALEGADDVAKEMALWSTPPSYLTIRSSNLLFQLTQAHERVGQIGEKQALLDALLWRSNRLLEEHGSSGITRFAAHRAGALSRQFVELATRVKHQIEQKSMCLRGIEKLQEARDCYSAWEKGIRADLAQARHENTADKVLAATKRITESVDMGDVLLDTCRRWALSVQSDALGSPAVEPSLVQDLMTSYAALKSLLFQEVQKAERQLTQYQSKQLQIASLSSWLDGAEASLQEVITSIFSPPPPARMSGGNSFLSIVIFCEQTATKALSELCALQSECSSRDPVDEDAQLISRFHAFKVKLAQCTKEVEERVKELSAYRESSELVALRQQLTLERYIQATGENCPTPETTSQLQDPPTTILDALLSPYDAQRRLTVLQDVYDEVMIEGRQLFETMIESADRLVSSSSWRQEDVFLVEVVNDRCETLRGEQMRLEGLTRKSIELLEGVLEMWRAIVKSEEALSEWLTGMEQAASRPKQDPETSLAEKRQALEEMQTLQSGLSHKAAAIEHLLCEAERLNQQVPQLQVAKRARQLSSRYRALVDFVQAQTRLDSEIIDELTRFESSLDCIYAKIVDYTSLVEEFRAEQTPASHVELTAKQSLLKSTLNNITTLRDSSELRDLLGNVERMKTHVSADVAERYTRRTTEIGVFVEDSTRHLEKVQCSITSKLEVWEKWSSLVTKLQDEVEQASFALKQAIADCKISATTNPVEELKGRKEALEKMRELHAVLASKKPEFNEIRRMVQAKDAEILDALLYRQSNDLISRFKALTADVQTRKTRLKRSWEGLFALSNKVNDADQWLLTASVKMAALNSAYADGPKAIAFLVQNCDNLVTEISHFLTDRLEQVIVEVRSSENSKRKKKKKITTKRKTSTRLSTTSVLLSQLETMKDEAEGLIQVTGVIKENLLAKACNWDELLVILENGEAFVELQLPRWWNSVIRPTEGEQATATSPLRLQIDQQPEALSTEVLRMIKDIEERRFQLESLSARLSTPWSPVTAPPVVRRRLQRIDLDDNEISSTASLGDGGVQTSGSKMRTRAEKLLGRLDDEVQKMKKLSDQLNTLKSLRDQRALCESEVADWLNLKESEVNSLISKRGTGEPDLGTTSLKNLRDELLAKRVVIDELASWQHGLLHSPDAEGNTIGELTDHLDTLVHRIEKRIKLHREVEHQALEASQLKSEVQEDLQKTIQRISMGESSRRIRGLQTVTNLRTAQSSPMTPQRGRSPLTVQLPPSPVTGSLEWLWYSPSSLLEQPADPANPTHPPLQQQDMSPSPPRIPLRPRRSCGQGRVGRSTPLINIQRRCRFGGGDDGGGGGGGSGFSSPQSCALDRFTDLRVDATPPPSVSPPPTPLLLGRSMSPYLIGRRWRRGSFQASPNAVASTSGLPQLTKKFSTSCTDLLPSRQALPPPSGIRAFCKPSDLARRRSRRKLEQQQKLDDRANT
uniref:Conserved oligomeric Golgi complex subunit 7 n=1 Tax=Mesocestoides corti TaxID=53468 RepID=A0A5K3FFU2_MESCO